MRVGDLYAGGYIARTADGEGDLSNGPLEIAFAAEHGVGPYSAQRTSGYGRHVPYGGFRVGAWHSFVGVDRALLVLLAMSVGVESLSVLRPIGRRCNAVQL